MEIVWEKKVEEEPCLVHQMGTSVLGGSRMVMSACTPVFLTAILTTGKIWQRQKCPSVDEWIRKRCFISDGVISCHL